MMMEMKDHKEKLSNCIKRKHNKEFFYILEVTDEFKCIQESRLKRKELNQL